jgi:hypothetical protein
MPTVDDIMSKVKWFEEKYLSPEKKRESDNID